MGRTAGLGSTIRQSLRLPTVLQTGTTQYEFSQCCP
jgi:hypothetical protein